MRFKNYFKDLIDPTIIVGVLIILAVSIIMTVFFTSKISGFKQKHRGKFLGYLIVFLLLTALITFIGSSEVFNNEVFSVFVFYQAVFFILGIIHCYIYRSYFEKFEQKSVWMEILFSFMMVIYTFIPMIIVFTMIKGNLYAYSIIFSSFVFMIPTFIYTVFESAISIPPKTFKTWLFPDNEHAYPDPPDSDYRDMLVVTFLFHKDPNTDFRTEFRAKAPIRMDFGRLFYHFVHDYNLRNPDSKIILTDKNGERQHWIFYLKSKKLGFAKYIKPKYPLYMNEIHEDSVIICQRTSSFLNSEEEIMSEIEKDKGEIVKENEKSMEKSNQNF